MLHFKTTWTTKNTQPNSVFKPNSTKNQKSQERYDDLRAGLVYTGNYSTSMGKIFKLPNIDKKAMASMQKIPKVEK